MAPRQIVLDTETTGLSARLGDRLIEIGCIEIVNRRVGESHFHRYLNPERDIDLGAERIHGLSREFLADKPLFREIAGEFLDYVRGAQLIIHNAPFDTEFLDRELALVGLGKLSEHCPSVIDTLPLARELHPGKKNTLDALCERYGVQNAHRTLHGALLDAELLAEVYLALTRGQDSLVMEEDAPAPVLGAPSAYDTSALVVVRASAAEIAEHDRVLDGIDKESRGETLWRKLGGDGAGP